MEGLDGGYYSAFLPASWYYWTFPKLLFPVVSSHALNICKYWYWFHLELLALYALVLTEQRCALRSDTIFFFFLVCVKSHKDLWGERYIGVVSESGCFPSSLTPGFSLREQGPTGADLPFPFLQDLAPDSDCTALPGRTPSNFREVQWSGFSLHWLGTQEDSGC